MGELSVSLFHFAPLALGRGSVIEPGNFGRMLGLYRYGVDNGWMLARELAFESERLRSAPSAPNRWKACFALPTIGEAQNYRSNAGHGVLMEVELVDPLAARHVGFLQHFDGMEQKAFVAEVATRAQAYWSGQGVGDREIVTSSGLRVLRVIP